MAGPTEKPLRLEDIANIVLHHLYTEASRGGMHWKLDAFIPMLSSYFSWSQTLFALEELNDRGFVRLGNNVFGDETLNFTREGYKYVEKELTDHKSALSQIDQHGIGNAIKMIAADYSTPPSKTSGSALADLWEPLPIDREDAATHDAIEKIRDVKNAAREENGYNASFPDERNAVVRNLEVAVEILEREATIVRMQFDAYIYQPLKQLYVRFGPAAVGVAAKLAWEAVKVVFKKFIDKAMDGDFS